MNVRLRLSAVLILLSPVTHAFQAGTMAGPSRGHGVEVAGAASVGLLQGEGIEHVYYYEPADGSRRQLSRLDWDLKDVVMGGGQVSVRVLPDLTLNGGLWMALTEGSGEMDNYDWFDPNSSAPTEYSLSEVDVTEGYIFDINMAWDFLVRESITTRAMLGYKQNGWTWEDRGVYALYSDYFYIPIDLGGENLIDYEQEFRMPYLGLSVDYRHERFTTSGYVVWSPVVAAEDWDHHIARTIKFHETFEGGDMFGVGAEVRYDWKNNIFFTASIQHQTIDLIIGDMELVDYSTGEYYAEEDVAGIENSYTAFMLGAGMNF